jgi:hypothetical protein
LTQLVGGGLILTGIAVVQRGEAAVPREAANPSQAD